MNAGNSRYFPNRSFKRLTYTLQLGKMMVVVVITLMMIALQKVNASNLSQPPSRLYLVHSLGTSGLKGVGWGGMGWEMKDQEPESLQMY